MCVCYDGNDSFDHRKRDQIGKVKKGTVCMCVYTIKRVLLFVIVNEKKL